jgi:hypothetical protein
LGRSHIQSYGPSRLLKSRVYRGAGANELNLFAKQARMTGPLTKKVDDARRLLRAGQHLRVVGLLDPRVFESGVSPRPGFRDRCGRSGQISASFGIVRISLALYRVPSPPVDRRGSRSGISESFALGFPSGDRRYRWCCRSCRCGVLTFTAVRCFAIGAAMRAATRPASRCSYVTRCSVIETLKTSFSFLVSVSVLRRQCGGATNARHAGSPVPLRPAHSRRGRGTPRSS